MRRLSLTYAIAFAALAASAASLAACSQGSGSANPVPPGVAAPANALENARPLPNSLPVLTASLTTPAAAAFCKAPKYPARYLWNPAATVEPPSPATSGKPRVEQYRGGKLIATYATLGSYDPNGTCARTENASAHPAATAGCGPFNRSEPFRQWLPGDRFYVYPAVYRGAQNQPWIGPGYDTAAQYSAGKPFLPTDIQVVGVTVNGVRPVIVVGATGASNNTLGQSALYFDRSLNVRFENIDIDAAGATAIGKAGVYVNGPRNLTLADMRVHGFETAAANGLFGTPNNSGTLELDRLELYDNGGNDGPDHNAYINASATDANYTVHLVNSWSHDAYYGHLFKSRAQVNDFEGNYFEGGLPQPGLSQAEAYLVDIPNGGRLTLRDNVLVKTASGPDSNGAFVTYAVEGIPDARKLGITIVNNTFAAFARTYDGSHPLWPMFFENGTVPGGSGFPVPAVTIERNAFIGFCPLGRPSLDYRGTLALTLAFSQLTTQYQLGLPYVSQDRSIVGAPAYAHAAQGGKLRKLPVIGASD